MQPKKRTRASHPKVRTGCHTCKARRVKCDELRPSCQKCLSTGRRCEGYKNTREWIVIVAPPAPITDGFEDDRSRRHFDYFRTQAVYELSWFFEGGQWGALVLQESHSSPAVRHAVIALACSHEDFRDQLTIESQAPQYAYAAHHYSKAIRALIKETSDDAQESRLKALICGLLFISLEIMRGNNTIALHHLDGCLKIVRETQAKMRTPYICGAVRPSPHDSLEADIRLSEEIIPMFARLDVQASAAGLLGRRPLHDSANTIAWNLPSCYMMQIDSLPFPGFQTVFEACDAMLTMANRLHRFMAWNSDLYRSQGLRPIESEVLAEKIDLGDQFELWESAVQPLLAASEREDDHDKIALMRIHNRTGQLLLESCLEVEECLHDNYHWAFENILDWTAQLQRAPLPGDEDSSSDSDSAAYLEPGNNQRARSNRSRASTPIKHRVRPFFLLDLGVIFALYWTALKYRDGLLRRRAISLLERSTQEGVWVGPFQAAMAKRVIEIEEGQPYEQFPPPEKTKVAQDIPEYARVHNVATDVDKLRRRARIVLLQKLDGLHGDWHERVEWVNCIGESNLGVSSPGLGGLCCFLVVDGFAHSVQTIRTVAGMCHARYQNYIEASAIQRHLLQFPPTQYTRTTQFIQYTRTLPSLSYPPIGYARITGSVRR